MTHETYMNQVKIKLQEMSVNWREETYQGILNQIENHLEQGFSPGADFHAGFAFALVCFNSGLESFISLRNLPVDLGKFEKIPESMKLAPIVPNDEQGIGKIVMEKADAHLRSFLGPASWSLNYEEKMVGLFFSLPYRFHAEQVANLPSQLMKILYQILGSDHTLVIALGEEANFFFDANTNDYRN